MSSTILETFLFIQVFILGALATVAVRYARTHFGLAKLEHEKPHPSNEAIPAALKQRLLKESEDKFESALNHAVSRLHHDLDASATQINQLVNNLATEIVAGEMERYRQELGRLHDQANTAMSSIGTEVAKHETELKTKMAQEIEVEKQRMIKQIDTKLADAVGSFLSETLSHNVDLGNQSAYLVAMLEEHKADFIKEVGQDETQPTK
jgi:F0F1-type ATP synthase membrane subunit b/b'